VTVDNASIAVTGTFWQATQPVSGTVTANLSATDNAVLDDIAADTESIKGYTDGIEGLLGTIDGDTGAIKTAVEVIDNAISGSEMQVDVITMPTTTVEATDLDTRDLSESSDSVAIYGSDDGGTTKRIIKTDAGGAIQMDIEVAEVTANAGTNLNTSALALETGGNLAAIKTNTDDIETLLTTIEGNQLADGHNVTVDNASIAVTGTVTANLGATDNAVLDNIDSNTDFGATVGGGTETGALRVTLANNSTGVVSVDDNGGSLTVDGTVTANLSATDNAVLDDIAADTESIKGYTDGIETVLGTIDADTGAIKTAVETIDNAISGTEMQVDVVGALPTGTNSIGNVGHNISGIGHGVKTVTTAGTDVALATSTTCKKVDIQAQTDNTGIIAVGGSGVDATVATGTGLILEAGDVYSIEIDNLADVYIDSSVSGEGVRFTYFT